MNIVKFSKEDFKKYTSKENFEKIINLDNVVSFLKFIKHNYADLKAIGKEDGSVATYSEFYNDVIKACSYLKTNNVKRGCNVGLVCGNNYSFAVVSMAIMAYGAVAVLLPAHLDDKTIYGCSMKYNLTTIIFEDSLLEKSGVVKQLTDKLVLNISSVFSINVNEEEMLLFNNEISKDDDACIIMTGGTTGRSKGALLTHDALMCGMINGCYGLEEVFHKTYYCLIPLTHVFGFIRNLMTSLYTGSCIFFNSDKRLMFDEFKKYQPTELVIVPALAELFLNLIKAYGIEFLGGKVKSIICGAASTPPYLVKEYNKFNITFCQGYGLTEFSNMVSGNPNGTEFPESVGMLYPDQEATVVNGELWLKGRNQMRCYYAEDEENKNAFEDGWFKTGDLVRFDENNNLYIIGRIKDVIVLPNGENVSPAYIESKINQLEIIQDSLVYEAKNTLGATILKLEVTLRPTVVKALNLSAEELNKFVNDKINEVNSTLLDYERVSEIVIRDKDFERSPSMKILRPKRLY